ncbi:MAG: type I-E CRISPR-associated protein Cse1/CasA [Hyphomicrobium sp.]|nr:type I-E CRISPR-associated protein Cse1/CasA [Hyphomicrobium sp.]
MSFNLLTDPWLPVRRLSGERDVVRPGDITDRFNSDPIMALDFPKPDWNAAVTELLIGLLATVMAPDDTDAWADLWATPPATAELNTRLANIAFAFYLDGDGPRCFQDIDPLPGCEAKSVAALLIDAPGENAEKKNTDLFVKRCDGPAFSPSYAAAALITLQTYAPAGGQGNRTSMRGGGPLTTMPMPRRKMITSKVAVTVTTLWDATWASVPDQTATGEVPKTTDSSAWTLIFPWLAPTRTSEQDRATQPVNAHVLQQFFGMPRRIRLDITASGDDCCAFGGAASEILVRGFRQQNYGVKYEGWVHHLSPHRADKKAGLLSFHPQPGGATFRDWLTWVETPMDRTTQRAACLDDWRARLGYLQKFSKYDDAIAAADIWQSSVLACGFDMDNMKARAWLDARIPFFAPPPGSNSDHWSDQFLRTARCLVAGTDKAAAALRFRSRLACFGSLDPEHGTYSLPKNSSGKDAFEDLIERFWRETEAAFRAALAALRNNPADDTKSIREAFVKELRTKALAFFDEIAGTDDLTGSDARRIVTARSNLQFAFGASGEVRRALDIATDEATQKAASRKKSKKRGEDNDRTPA